MRADSNSSEQSSSFLSIFDLRYARRELCSTGLQDLLANRDFINNTILQNTTMNFILIECFFTSTQFRINHICSCYTSSTEQAVLISIHACASSTVDVHIYKRKKCRRTLLYKTVYKNEVKPRTWV